MPDVYGDKENFMAGAQRGLGKGLTALLDSAPTPSKSERIALVPLDHIVPNKQQPRRTFSDASLQDLAASISAQGVLQPILVRRASPNDEGVYELIAGERRWRAAKLANLLEIPALIKPASDEESLTFALIENLQREDLNPIEEAQGLLKLQEQLACNQDKLAQIIGKSRPAVANAFRLLQLPDFIQDDIRNGALSAGHGRGLLSIDDPEAQRQLRDKIIEHGYSVREVEAQAAHWREYTSLPQTQLVSVLAKSQKSHSAQTTPEPAVLDLQSKISEQLGLQVRLRGSLNKGQLVLPFASQEQLSAVLALLGVHV
jgi:ParB family chromosome partitioning protein